MRGTQQNLPTIKRANHSNLGRDFEKHLESVHSEYAARKIGKIDRNPVEWAYTTRSVIEKLRAGGTGDAAIRAQTDSGAYLIKTKSNVDFSGGYRGFAVAFDAKESAGKSIPLSNFRRDQVQRMCDSEACGNVAGFMVRFSELDRVFFLAARMVREFMDAAQFNDGRKSIALLACEVRGLEIPCVRGIFDWGRILFPKKVNTI